MSGLDDLLKGLAVFQDGIKQLAVGKGISDANEKLAQVNSDQQRGILSQEDAFQQRSNIGTDLGMRIAQSGGDAGLVSSLMGQLSPSAGAQFQAQQNKELQSSSQQAATDQLKLQHRQALELQEKKNEILTGKADTKNANWMVAQQDKFMKSSEKDIKALESLDKFQKLIDKGETSRIGVEMGKTALLKDAGEDRIVNEDIQRANNDPSIRRKIARAIKMELTGEEIDDTKKFYSKLFKQLRADARQRLGAKVKGNSESLASLNSNVDGSKYESALRMRIPSLAEDAKTIVKKMYSPKQNKTKLIYSDGTEQVVDGRQ